MALPYLTHEVDPIEAELPSEPEDFVVDEVSAYSPIGSGDHVFVRLEKRDLTTRDAVRTLCATLGVDPARAGWAGLKDRRAVTRQWVSLFGTTPEAIRQVRLEGIRVLDAERHPHKLRTGHLRANRFRIRLRGFDDRRLADLRLVLSRLKSEGLPNYYGQQRFGHWGDNAERALRWVRGEEPAPRHGFHRKLQMSALQSALFNRCLGERMRTSKLGDVLVGEVAKKHVTGGVFVVQDAVQAQARADRWEISPTGPMYGAKMRWPAADRRALEERVLSESGLSFEQLSKWKRIAPGARRFIRVPLEDLDLERETRGVVLSFTLPAGSYATILLREIVKWDARSAKSG